MRLARANSGRRTFAAYIWIAILTVAAHGQSAGVLPRIEGESLAGRKVVFPDATTGKVSVLILGFTKASKEPTSAWADKIRSEFGSRSGFELYQLPVLEDVPRVIRGMVISGIKKGVKEDVRDHFVPIVQAESTLKKLVGYKEADDAYLLVLDPAGQIVQQVHGPFSNSAYSDLRGELEVLLKR